MALPPNQGAPWPPQMQGQVPPRPQGQPNYPTPAQQQQQQQQMAMQRQMQAQQQFGAAPQGGMPKQQPGAGPQPLNRLPAANAGSISFNVSGAQPKGPVHAQMHVQQGAPQGGQQMQRIVPQGQMAPGGQLAPKPMNVGAMNPSMNVAGRGMGGMQGSSGMSGPGGAAGGGSGPVSGGGQPGAGDVGVPKVMQGDGRILSKQKLQELVSYIDSDERLDADAEDLLMLIADEFVESVTSFACRIAKHRKSPKLEVKDLQFHLDQNWGIKVPGFGAEEEKGPVRLPMNDAHRQRLQAVKRNRQK